MYEHKSSILFIVFLSLWFNCQIRHTGFVDEMQSGWCVSVCINLSSINLVKCIDIRKLMDTNIVSPHQVCFSLIVGWSSIFHLLLRRYFAVLFMWLPDVCLAWVSCSILSIALHHCLFHSLLIPYLLLRFCPISSFSLLLKVLLYFFISAGEVQLYPISVKTQVGGKLELQVNFSICIHWSYWYTCLFACSKLILATLIIWFIYFSVYIAFSISE